MVWSGLCGRASEMELYFLNCVVVVVVVGLLNAAIGVVGDNSNRLVAMIRRTLAQGQ